MTTDTMNKFGVSLHAGSGNVALLLPPAGTISKADALNLAAWLVALADPIGDEFNKVREAVMGT